jgi:hypothetical protein
VLATGVVDFGHADALLQGVRYDDDVTGSGWSLASGGSVAITGPLRARARVTRSVGDGTFRSWQWRFGPELRFHDTASVAAFYESYAAGDSASTHGVAAEGLAVLTPKFTGRADAGWATGDGATRIAQLTVGGIWHAMPHLALSADAGWASLQGATRETYSLGEGGGLPLLGGGRDRRSASRTDVAEQGAATLLLGARVIFP